MTPDASDIDTRSTVRARSRAVCLVAYAVAGAVAVAVGWALRGQHPLWVVAAADVAATVAVFAFSFALGNSSLYDPYWSIAPPFIALYAVLGPGSAEAGAEAVGTRQLGVLALVWLWGARLTWNWLRGWSGLDHEDWRYVELREQSGRAWWGVSFLGVHLFPTLIVLAASLSLFPALIAGDRPLGALDALAALVTAGGIALEAGADQQLRRFVQAGRARGATLTEGLWAHVRHPNYLGENLFWWGLWLFGLAADPSWWWSVAGPLAIGVMFASVSIPMIDRRMQARRPDYEAYRARVPALLPRPWRRA